LLAAGCAGGTDAGPAAGDRQAAQAGQDQGERQILFYRNPMDPSITSPVPAKDGMGMDYIPVYADEEVPDAGTGAAGLATVTVGRQGLELAGVVTTPAVREVLGHSTRTVGVVTADETRIRHVHTKISGWIETLYVNFTGQQVRAGKPILTIYSPQLLASQEEFLRAREAAARFAGSSLPEVRKGGEELVTAARRRLELFDVPQSFLAELEATGKPRRSVALLAPVSGYVTAKEVFEGQEVQPGMELFTLTDLSHVWVEAEFYEYEARLLKVGQEATLFLPFDPHLHRRGRVTYIYPTLNAETRTLRARLEFANADLALKPGMYADVEADLATHEGVVIPDSALIATGLREVVFVEREPGVFEPREVRAGIRASGKALIAQGLAEGERVVVRGNFLLDSESRLRAALAGMGGGAPAAPVVGLPAGREPASAAAEPSPHAGHQH
jgi:RND family efflux transporter MFP subunit